MPLATPTDLQQDIFKDGWFGYSHDVDDKSEIDEEKYNLVAEMVAAVILIKSEKNIIPGLDFEYESYDEGWYTGSISDNKMIRSNLIDLYAEAGEIELDHFGKSYIVGWPQELC